MIFSANNCGSDNIADFTNSEKIRDKIEMKEVPLGSIEGIGNGIPTMVDCGELKCRHIGLPGHPNHGRKNDDFDSFRFFNRCNCRETEKRN